MLRLRRESTQQWSGWRWEVTFLGEGPSGQAKVEVDYRGAEVGRDGGDQEVKKLRVEGDFECRDGEVVVKCSPFRLQAGPALGGMSVLWSVADVVSALERTTRPFPEDSKGSLRSSLQQLAGLYESTVRSETDDDEVKEKVNLRTVSDPPDRMHLSNLVNEASTTSERTFSPRSVADVLSLKRSCREDDDDDLHQTDKDTTKDLVLRTTGRRSRLDIERGRMNRIVLDELNRQWTELDETGKYTLLRLSLFPNSFPIQAAEGCSPHGEDHLLVEVGSLARKNLVYFDREKERCSLHESVRSMMRAMVNSSGISLESARKAAVEYFIRKLAHVDGIARKDTMDSYFYSQKEFLEDKDNYLFAFESSGTIADMEAYRRLAVAGLYHMRYCLAPQQRVSIYNRLRENHKTAAGGITEAQTAEDAELAAAMGRAYLDSSMAHEAEEYFQNAIMYYRPLSENESDTVSPIKLAQVLQNLAQVKTSLGDSEAAVEVHMEALSYRLRTQRRDSIPVAVNMRCMAETLFAMKKFDDAESLLNHLIRVWESNGMVKTKEYAHSLFLLGMIALEHGELESARSACETALDVYNSSPIIMTNLVLLEGMLHLGLGKVYEAQKDVEGALRKYRISFRHLNKWGLSSDPAAKFAGTAISRCKQSLYRSKKRQKTMQRSAQRPSKTGLSQELGQSTVATSVSNMS